MDIWESTTDRRNPDKMDLITIMHTEDLQDQECKAKDLGMAHNKEEGLGNLVHKIHMGMMDMADLNHNVNFQTIMAHDQWRLLQDSFLMIRRDH